MVDSTGFGAVWPSPQSDVSAIIVPSRSSRSISAVSPSPRVMRVSISSIRLVPMRHGAHLPHDSCCTKSVKKRAISTMQVASSITISPPEPMIAPIPFTES